MLSKMKLAILVALVALLSPLVSVRAQECPDCDCEHYCCGSGDGLGGGCNKPQPPPPARTVMVHLFEWSWNDIARECTEFLGPYGYAAVQISPPQEHIPGTQWWTRYQPISYILESRSGNRDQFINMVQTCATAGVDIYVDAVINHMSTPGEGSQTGTAGSVWSYHRYPPLYGPNDFHACSPDVIGNYQDAYRVQHCSIGDRSPGLSDLKTGSEWVRTKIADYLKDCMDLGVKGFRIDAAKHMPVADIAAIVDKLPEPKPYIFQEVIPGFGEPIQPEHYTGVGDLMEFRYGRALHGKFTNERLADLKTFGESWGFLSSLQAVVFTNNHDNQRYEQDHVLTYKNGVLHDLGNIFMLAWPYGYPRVMSSYDYRDDQQGPPNSSPFDGCSSGGGGGWICEHRTPAIARMVGFRNACNSQAPFVPTHWWTNGYQRIAFGRGGLGFVAINREGFDMRETLMTGMRPGSYCDVISGERDENGRCTGKVVTVKADGSIDASVPGMSAIAIHVHQMRGNTNPYKYVYETVNFRGTPNSWGVKSMKLVGDYTWETDVTFEGDVDPRFKFDIHGDWTVNYGLGVGGGAKLERAGQDIPAASIVGKVKIVFNDQTKEVKQHPDMVQ